MSSRSNNNLKTAGDNGPITSSVSDQLSLNLNEISIPTEHSILSTPEIMKLMKSSNSANTKLPDLVKEKGAEEPEIEAVGINPPPLIVESGDEVGELNMKATVESNGTTASGDELRQKIRSSGQAIRRQASMMSVKTSSMATLKDPGITSSPTVADSKKIIIHLPPIMTVDSPFSLFKGQGDAKGAQVEGGDDNNNKNASPSSPQSDEERSKLASSIEVNLLPAFPVYALTGKEDPNEQLIQRFLENNESAKGGGSDLFKITNSQRKSVVNAASSNSATTSPMVSPNAASPGFFSRLRKKSVGAASIDSASIPTEFTLKDIFDDLKGGELTVDSESTNVKLMKCMLALGDSDWESINEDIAQGMTFHESNKLVESADCFERAGRRHAPLGLYFYGLCFRHGWGRTEDMQKGFRCLYLAAHCAIILAQIEMTRLEEHIISNQQKPQRSSGNNRGENSAILFRDAILKSGERASSFLEDPENFNASIPAPFSLDEEVERESCSSSSSGEIERENAARSSGKMILEIPPAALVEATSRRGSSTVANLVQKLDTITDLMGTTQLIYRSELALILHELGVCYQRGWGTPVIPVYAAYYFNLAALLGDPDAQNEMGFCFKKGFGVSRNKKRSAFFYRLADKNGNGLVANSWIYKDKYM